MSKDYTLREWENVLQFDGTIDPATIELAERKVEELKEEDMLIGMGATDYWTMRRFMRKL